MIIRPLKKEDIPSASALVEDNYSAEYGQRSFHELEAMFSHKVAPPRYLVAEEKAEIIGFAGYIQSWMDYNVYQIFWVNVAPKYQGKGVGTALVAEVIRLIRQEKDAQVILLTTDKPDFYSKKFSFEPLMSFGEKSEGYRLMVLRLEA